MVGKEWLRTNSIAQGCPLSMMWANLVGAVWSKIMKNEVLEVTKNIFADDKSIRTTDRQ